MTNFGALMDLLNISTKKFSEVNIQASLVSRWRTGKRRIMPERYIVKKISEIIIAADEKRSSPILSSVLQIWYPGEEAEQRMLLERFLTEKGQLEPTYQIRLEKLLKNLSLPKNDYPAVRGFEAAQIRILDFFNTILKQPVPVSFKIVFPQGLGLYLVGAEHNHRFFELVEKIFKAGHRATIVSCATFSVTNVIPYWSGYIKDNLTRNIHTLLYDNYCQTEESFLGVIEGITALEVKLITPGRLDSSVSIFSHEKDFMESVDSRIEKYANLAVPMSTYNFWEKPSGTFSKCVIPSHDSSYYVTRLPHFGILSQEQFEEVFNLTPQENETILREAFPVALTPAYFSEKATYRIVLCVEDIEDALLKKRHWIPEISALLGRRVCMTTQRLVDNLIEIKKLLQKHNNLEVCFLHREHFNTFHLQCISHGRSASIAWISEKASVAAANYKGPVMLSSCCQYHWSTIPSHLKSKPAAKRIIDLLLKKASLYGYSIVEKLDI